MRGKWFLIGLSTFSLVFHPMAWGQQQQNWTAEALKQFVRENQKGNKPITAKQFWDKNKGYLHPYWQLKLNHGMQLQKNDKLPKMDVIQVKGPRGTQSARLMLTQNGRTISMEYIGQNDKFVRINNTVISFQEFYSGQDMFKKLARDPYFAAEIKKLKQKSAKQSILPSYALFSKMTPRERAAYFVNLRLLIEASEKVIHERVQKKYAAQESVSPYLEMILNRAYADKVWLNEPCIVAGYVGKYIKDSTGTYCDHKEAISPFAQSASGAVQKKVATKVYDNSCGHGQLRCNPFIFGFDRGQGSLCIKISRSPVAEFQKATATCDARSPLPLGNKTVLAKNTEAMIKTLLQQEGKDANEFFKEGKVISKEKYQELENTVVKDFSNFIEEGIGICFGQGNIDVTKFGEKNQISACQTLYNRKLAFMEGFDNLKGKYEDPPLPAPAPPAEPPAPPIAGPPCAPGHVPGPEGKGCVPEAVPAPIATSDVTGCGPMMDTSYDNGKQICTPVAARLPSSSSTGRSSRDRDRDYSWLIPVVGGVIITAGLWALLKPSKAKHNPKPADPIAPPPLPPVEPPPVQPDPGAVPPITSIPITPALPPGAAETAPSAPTFDPDAGGVTR